MLTCVSRSNQPDDRNEDTPVGKKSMKKLGSHIKEMALKASGAYRSCTPCTGPVTTMTPQKSYNYSSVESSESERVKWSHMRRSGSKNSSSGRVVWGKEMEARLKGISMGGSGEVSLSASASGRILDPIVVMDEIEPKEWVAQVEPGVLITFISLPPGANHLKQIRFSREMFNQLQAQRWWQENFEKVMELYNVQKLSRHAFPLPTTPNSETEPAPDSKSSKVDHQGSTQMCSDGESSGLSITPNVSSINGTKTETSSMDAFTSASSSKEADRQEEPSVSSVSDVDNEWVEEDEPGVYITIRALPGGSRELRRVRFSREKYGEVHARLWWEENRARIHKHYLYL